jgi:molybdopterin-biosynthesis enzyme MoeA-like protein
MNMNLTVTSTSSLLQPLYRYRLLIIGDEILSGKRQDKHMAKALELLKERGLSVAEVTYLGDEPQAITDFLTRSFAQAKNNNEVLFSFGGIGATPDDHTRQATADALGLPLALHPEAERLIAERCADMGNGDMSHPDNVRRLNMGRFPIGAGILPNSYNKIPGFYIHNHFFLPGFPVMAWPMLAYALDTFFSEDFHRHIHHAKSVKVLGQPESALIPLMEGMEKTYPQVKVFSLPHVGNGSDPQYIELGVKSNDATLMETAFAEMCAALQSRQIELQDM